MPSIQTASTAVTSFPNMFSSPYGNDEIVPLYSSVPLKSPVAGCLPCVVCGNSIVRQQVTSNSGFSKTSAGGVTLVTGPNPIFPAPPTNISFDFEGGPQATICWQPPTYQGQSNVVGYNIYVDGVLVLNVSSPSLCGAVSWDYTSSHTISVTAVNSQGEGRHSTILSIGSIHIPWVETFHPSGSGPQYCSDPVQFMGSTLISNPLNQTVWAVGVGSVDDDLLIDGTIYQAGQFPSDLFPTCTPPRNGAHGLTFSTQVPSLGSFTLGVNNNWSNMSSVNLDVYIVVQNASIL